MQLYELQTVSMAEKNCFSHYVCHCGAVVKELFTGAYKPGSTPGDAIFCLLVAPFFCLFFFNAIFPFSLFPLFLLLTLMVMHLDQYIF